MNRIYGLPRIDQDNPVRLARSEVTETRLHFLVKGGAFCFKTSFVHALSQAISRTRTAKTRLKIAVEHYSHPRGAVIRKRFVQRLYHLGTKPSAATLIRFA